MADITVTISTNNPAFFDALDRPEGFIPLLAARAGSLCEIAISELQKYPPETEANAPGRFSMRDHRPMGFYERDRGWWYPIKGDTDEGRWVGAGQSVSRMRIKTMALKTRGRAKSAFGVTGYKLRPTSERLKDSWVLIVKQKTDEVSMNIGNLATYSGYVQGFEQTAQMFKYGWRAIDVVFSDMHLSDLFKHIEHDALSAYYNLGGPG